MKKVGLMILVFLSSNNLIKGSDRLSELQEFLIQKELLFTDLARLQKSIKEVDDEILMVKDRLKIKRYDSSLNLVMDNLEARSKADKQKFEQLVKRSAIIDERLRGIVK